MNQMKKKKSSGKDGVTQECLLMGKNTLVMPITWLIYTSIASGIFPKEWKEAIINLILKKGAPTDKTKCNQVFDIMIVLLQF